jgi:copper homeostasis protein
MAAMLEICIDGVASARAAAAGGADRVELCANLPEGGTTPSAGTIRAVRAAFSGGLMVMIRPRGYDFLYSEDEMQVMRHDIAVARDYGADGIVIGCLTADGRVDVIRSERLLSDAGAMDVTFHRAFDMTRDPAEALEDIVRLGFKRVLTSGGKPDVPAGIATIRNLVTQAAGRIAVMPGGGVTEDNVAEIVRATGAREIHMSARDAVRSGMIYRNEKCAMGSYSGSHEYEWREASVEKIRKAKSALVACLVSAQEAAPAQNAFAR